jgi:hypothetical protein
MVPNGHYVSEHEVALQKSESKITAFDINRDRVVELIIESAWCQYVIRTE